jgi:hypothetical protein
MRGSEEIPGCGFAHLGCILPYVLTVDYFRLIMLPPSNEREGAIMVKASFCAIGALIFAGVCTADAAPNVHGTVVLAGPWSKRVSCSNVLVWATTTPAIDPGKDLLSSRRVGKSARATGGVVGENGVCSFGLTIPGSISSVLVFASHPRFPRSGDGMGQPSPVPNISVNVPIWAIPHS